MVVESELAMGPALPSKRAWAYNRGCESSAKQTLQSKISHLNSASNPAGVFARWAAQERVLLSFCQCDVVGYEVGANRAPFLRACRWDLHWIFCC